MAQRDSDIGILDNKIENIEKDVSSLQKQHTQFLSRVEASERQHAINYTKISGDIEKISEGVKEVGFGLKVVKEFLVGDLKTAGIVERVGSVEESLRKAEKKGSEHHKIIYTGIVTLLCGLALLFVTSHFGESHSSPEQIKAIVEQVQKAK